MQKSFNYLIFKFQKYPMIFHTKYQSDNFDTFVFFINYQ